MCGTKGYSGLAIADYFIKKCLENGTPITNMSVLKMIYFAHGLAYPTLHRKLIKDPFYAWGWGPVEKKHTIVLNNMLLILLKVYLVKQIKNKRHRTR